MKYLSKYIMFKGKDIVRTLMKVNGFRMPALIGGFGKENKNNFYSTLNLQRDNDDTNLLREKLGP